MNLIMNLSESCYFVRVLLSWRVSLEF